MTWLDMSKGPCIQTRKDENVFVVGLETIYEKSTSGFFHLGHFLSLNQIKRCSLFFLTVLIYQWESIVFKGD